MSRTPRQEGLPALETVWLFGERDFPAVEINEHQIVDVDLLPVSEATKAKVRAWLALAGFGSEEPTERVLLAAVRAANAIAADTPASVRVNVALFDTADNRWVSLDVHRL